MKDHGHYKRYTMDLEKNRKKEEGRKKILQEKAEDDIAAAKKSFTFDIRNCTSKRKQEWKLEQETALKLVKLNGKKDAAKKRGDGERCKEGKN